MQSFVHYVHSWHKISINRPTIYPTIFHHVLFKTKLKTLSRFYFCELLLVRDSIISISSDEDDFDDGTVAVANSGTVIQTLVLTFYKTGASCSKHR